MNPTLTLDLTWKLDVFVDQLPTGEYITFIGGVRLVEATLTREDGITIFTIGTDTGAINLDYVVKIVRFAAMYSGGDIGFVVRQQVI
jgi:hypothetical protein